jgi:hypothetical protein
MPLFVGLGVGAALLLITAVVILVNRRNRKENSDEEDDKETDFVYYARPKTEDYEKGFKALGKGTNMQMQNQTLRSEPNIPVNTMMPSYSDADLPAYPEAALSPNNYNDRMYSMMSTATESHFELNGIEGLLKGGNRNTADSVHFKNLSAAYGSMSRDSIATDFFKGSES